MGKIILDECVFEAAGNPEIQSSKMGYTNFFLAFFLIVQILVGCGEKDPPPTLEEQLNGSWMRVHGFIENRYRFNAGDLDVYNVFSSQIVFEDHYVYTTAGDTLRLLNMVDGVRSEFTVEFPTDSTAELHPEFGLTIHIKRFEP